MFSCTVKPVLSGHSKIDKRKILMASGCLMKVESIAECSHWSTLQYFWPALSDNWSRKPIFGLTQVLFCILVLRPFWWGRESWLLCLICLPGVLWWLGGSSLWCRGVVCCLWMWCFLIILFLLYIKKIIKNSHFSIEKKTLILGYEKPVHHISFIYMFLSTLTKVKTCDTSCFLLSHYAG